MRFAVLSDAMVCYATARLPQQGGSTSKEILLLSLPLGVTGS